MKDLGVLFITYYYFDNSEDNDTEKESIIILNVCLYLESFLEINIFLRGHYTGKDWFMINIFKEINVKNK